MWLASVTGLASVPPPVRLDVVAGDGASPAQVAELRAWLQAALEKEGISFVGANAAPLPGEWVRLLVVELGDGQWRVWTAQAPDAVVAIDARDYAVASLEALHQASLLLKEHTVAEPEGPIAVSAELAEGAPVTQVAAQPQAERPELPADVGLDPDPEPAVPVQQTWLDVNLGFVVSGRSNFVLGLGGSMYRSPHWGVLAGASVHHVSDFVSFDNSWNLSIWNYRASAGPLFTLPLGERLRFNTAVEVGLLVHSYAFTGEGWDARLNALARVPLAFVYQGRDWRAGIAVDVTLNSATFTHRVFDVPVWETERLSAAMTVSLGRHLW